MDKTTANVPGLDRPAFDRLLFQLHDARAAADGSGVETICERLLGMIGTAQDHLLGLLEPAHPVTARLKVHRVSADSLSPARFLDLPQAYMAARSLQEAVRALDDVIERLDQT